VSRSAKVESIDALRSFRGALLKFAEMVNAGVHDAENDLHRTLIWLETEQSLYWRDQQRKTHEEVSRAEEAVRMKRVMKGFDGKPQSTVEEEKQLANARRKFEYADTKQRNVRKWVPVLQKEIMTFKGSIQRMSTAAQVDVPNAIGKLERLVIQLEEYAALATPGEAIGEVPLATSETTSSAGAAPNSENAEPKGS
jgi:hypothetical protein